MERHRAKDNVVLVNGLVLYGVGCPVFVPELHQVVWPPKFKSNAPVEYNGKTNPIEFLHMYITVMHASGAEDTAMANWFWPSSPMSVLVDEPPGKIRPLLTRPMRSIRWGFQGRLRAQESRAICLLVQNSGEPLRKYIQRFGQVQQAFPHRRCNSD